MAKTDTITLGKLEITGTPEKVETGVYGDGRAMLREHFPDHVVTTVMEAPQLSDLIANLQKALALLQARAVRKN